MEVRAATEHDREEWLRLRERCWPERGRRHHESAIELILQRRFQHTALLCVHREAGVVGLAEASRRPRVDGCESAPVGYLESLYVEPEHRAGEALQRLVAAAEAWAAAHGCREMAAAAQPGDAQADAAHRALGYAEALQLVVYRKPLAATAATGGAPPQPAAPVGSGTAPAPARGLRLAVHAGLFCLAGVAFYHTDIWSRDVFRGAVLPLLDAAFVIYALVLAGLWLYRRRTARPQRELASYVQEDAPSGAEALRGRD